MKFKVWWVPQVPMKAFEVPVESREEGMRLCDILGRYDAFQFENKIKPDYCNTGGVVFVARPISNHDDDWIDVPEDDEEWNEYLKEIADFETSDLLPVRKK